MMKIESPGFTEGEDMPPVCAREGGNLRPPLRILGVPERARSLALILEDIDSPIGPFTHWVVWNIPPRTEELPADQLPDAAREGMNGFGEVGYLGPCPPSGRHRYRFRLLALDREMETAPAERRDRLEREMRGHVLAEAELIGCYRAPLS